MSDTVALGVYSLYDIVAEAYFAPTLFESDAVAIRDTKYLFNADEKFKANAHDYQLVFIGDFDKRSGALIGLDHRVLCRCNELVEKEN